MPQKYSIRTATGKIVASGRVETNEALTASFEVDNTPLRYRRTRIRCITNGQVFYSAAAACAALGVNAGSLSNHLNNPTVYKHAGGYTFERIE